jgi:hypothetical protein
MTDTETRVTDGAGVFAGVRAKDRRDGGENIVAAEIEAARIRDIFGTGGFELDRRDRSGESPEDICVEPIDGLRPLVGGKGKSVALRARICSSACSARFETAAKDARAAETRPREYAPSSSSASRPMPSLAVRSSSVRASSSDHIARSRA